ncbi:MAG: DUF4179 domain-containing protein [Lysinibacillus sp.]
MKDFDEQNYDAIVEELEKVPVPQDKLAEARTVSFIRGQREKVRRKRAWQGVAMAAVFVLLFVTSIRISPAFAREVAKIPGFAPLVEMIAYDKGMKDILVNDYYEELDITKTKNGLTYSLIGVIADESGMVLSTQLLAPFDIHQLHVKNVEIVHNGKPLKASMTYGWADQQEPTNTIDSKIEIISKESIDYTNSTFELKISLTDEWQTTFSIPFSINRELAKSEEYTLDEVVEIDGQLINVKSLKVSPLRTELRLSVDPTNTMRILGFETIQLIDEKGEVWGAIEDGVIGTGSLLNGEVSYFIQSNYFRQPKSLTIRLGKVQALPIGQDYIEVDFLTKKVLYAPPFDGLDIRVLDFNTIEVKSTMISDFSDAVDMNGENVYIIGGTHMAISEGRTNESTYSFNLRGATNPIRIYFNQYENYLQGSAEIKVPLK